MFRVDQSSYVPSEKHQEYDSDLFPDNLDQNNKEYSREYEKEYEEEPIIEPKKSWQPDYRFFYLFGILLLILGIGFLYVQSTITEIQENEGLLITINYALGK